MPNTLSYCQRNITSQNLSSPISIIKVIITWEWTLRLLNYDRSTGLSMGEKKYSDENESVMSANLEKDAGVNKSLHPYLKSDLAHHYDVLLIAQSIFLAPLPLSWGERWLRSVICACLPVYLILVGEMSFTQKRKKIIIIIILLIINITLLGTATIMRKKTKKRTVPRYH